MGKLEELAGDLLVKYDNHESRLDKAFRKTGQVLDILDATAASATGLQSSVFSSFGLSGVWPYIICPFLSLAMGSYGLQPSLVRNIWLVGFGKFLNLSKTFADCIRRVDGHGCVKSRFLQRCFRLSIDSRNP
jgi:hypothetical protein